MPKGVNALRHNFYAEGIMSHGDDAAQGWNKHSRVFPPQNFQAPY